MPLIRTLCYFINLPEPPAINLAYDFVDTELLLSPDNVDQNALQLYAREAADFSTNHQLPSLDFAMNHYGQPDVAMFDFTSFLAHGNRHSSRFSCSPGLSLDDSQLGKRVSPLDVLALRESLYRILPQTTPENMQKMSVSILWTRPQDITNVNTLPITPAQFMVKYLSGAMTVWSFTHSNKLLTWCQERTRGYSGVTIHDLTTSWKNGLALCALIHSYSPELIDYHSLDKSEVEENIQLAFDVAERELGISPLITVDELLSVGEPDSLSMVMYLSHFYQLLSNTPPAAGGGNVPSVSDSPSSSEATAQLPAGFSDGGSANKKQTATPERIELENCRRCSTNIETKPLNELEEPQEVSEETLNELT
ncbi:hypothetical protein WMY93_022048 [Mugilogobius chulae]|uniref:Calponin-homology (CH) domain-containing protein n=1 Tax=Mugilogobius chulae TaxID=88201 RepID=A0AAW0NCL3_9GOBI